MSRVGKNPITIPAGVSVEVTPGGRYGHLLVKVNGPKGGLEESIRQPINVEVTEGQVLVTRPNDLKQVRSYHGLYRALIANMVKGVTDGYDIDLEIIGIGYRGEQKADGASFSLGYSHKIDYVPPMGVVVTIADQTQIKVSGANKELVGREAAKIRGFRPPEPYKGKGIRYKGEEVRRKSVKQG